MKILVADDDPISRHLLDATLVRWGYEVVQASDGDEAWRVLESEAAPSLVLLDWMMPGLDGLEVCRKLRQRGGEPYAYVLLLTAKQRKEDVIAGLEAGADDYLVKPFNTQELRVRLRAGVRILELQAELIAAREEARHQATHDPLTGVWNRGAILDLLKRELARHRRAKGSVGIVLADLDHFKQVNDLHGHQAGDAVLCEAVRRLGGSIRIYDAIGRYGGEEFLLVLPNCERADLVPLLERLRASIDASPIRVGAQSLRQTCSFGAVASAQALHAPQDLLLRAADVALYRAKKNGRNCAELATLADMALGEGAGAVSPSVWMG